MKNFTAGGQTQDERKLALAKYLATSRLKEKLGLSPEKEEVDEHYSDLENYSENKYSRIYANREEIYEVKTLEELKEECREDMLSFDKRRAETEFDADEANMSIEEYVKDYIENDEYRNNEITREYNKFENYFIKMNVM